MIDSPIGFVAEIVAAKTLSRLHNAPEIAQDAPITTSAPSATTYRGMGKGVERWRSLVGEHFKAGDVDRVLCLMSHESGGNPDARNPSSGASGLMQVMPFWADELGYARSALFDPGVNLSIARYLRDNGGWNYWSPYKRGLCHG